MTNCSFLNSPSAETEITGEALRYYKHVLCDALRGGILLKGYREMNKIFRD